ncbi:hypothetical protein B0T16DRAFT_400769 [Cercophora newfieldiana]|uniref:Uncharacterized protein n=1 Tax=Cercophora newfieldiana TaxID=92897 RepID=A0AA39YR07_9PEZI|nr:hypothetical protein B0T16DRAFT_400769 [Cercophora newfieldiana]
MPCVTSNSAVRILPLADHLNDAWSGLVDIHRNAIHAIHLQEAEGRVWSLEHTFSINDGRRGIGYSFSDGSP